MTMDTFTDAQMMRLARMTKAKILEVLNVYSIRDCLLFHRRLTESIVGFSKRNKHLLTLQWELVCIAEMVRRMAYRAIYDDFKIQIKLKYPQITDPQLKALTKEKTEKIIKKYSY